MQLYEALADQLTDIVVNSVSVASGVNILKLLEKRRLSQILTASIFELTMFYLFVQVLCIRKPEEAIDLFMVEIMHMRHKFDVDTRLVS